MHMHAFVLERSYYLTDSGRISRYCIVPFPKIHIFTENSENNVALKKEANCLITATITMYLVTNYNNHVNNRLHRRRANN